MDEPKFRDIPGATRLEIEKNRGFQKNFLTGGTDGEQRLRLSVFRRDSDQALVGQVWPGPAAEGPPAHAHGGWIATVLDQAMGAALFQKGYTAMTANLSVDYRKPIPLGSTVNLEAWVDSVENRRIYCRARLTDESGQTFARSKGLFVQLTEEQKTAITSQMKKEQE